MVPLHKIGWGKWVHHKNFCRRSCLTIWRVSCPQLMNDWWVQLGQHILRLMLWFRSEFYLVLLEKLVLQHFVGKKIMKFFGAVVEAEIDLIPKPTTEPTGGAGAPTLQYGPLWFARVSYICSLLQLSFQVVRLFCTTILKKPLFHCEVIFFTMPMVFSLKDFPCKSVCSLFSIFFTDFYLERLSTQFTIQICCFLKIEAWLAS